MFDQFDRQQCINLVTGILGIYAVYLTSAVFDELVIKADYYNNKTQQTEPAIYCPEGIACVPSLFSWIAGTIYNQIILKRKSGIPEKNSFYCGLIIFISAYTYTHAVVRTNFPVVMVFKSSNVLSVLLVAIFCSRVKEKKLQLGKKKLIVGIVLTIGVLIFNLFDPATRQRSRESEFSGIAFLIVSLLADGFLPDFQAQIKSVYNPHPTQMMEKINKWVVIASVIVMIVNQSLLPFINFILDHHLFALHLCSLATLAWLGQLFVYRLIKQFKQHIVPFVITSRKIMTIIISVLFVGNKKYSYTQFLGVLIIFCSVAFEFKSELKKETRIQLSSQQEKSIKNIEMENPGQSQILEEVKDEDR